MRITSIFDLVIWGVLATHNPLGHCLLLVLLLPFWLKLYEQIVELLFAYARHGNKHVCMHTVVVLVCRVFGVSPVNS